MNINTRKKIRDGFVRLRAKIVLPFYKLGKFLRNQVPQLVLSAVIATGSTIATIQSMGADNLDGKIIVHGLLGWLYVGYRYFSGP